MLTWGARLSPDATAAKTVDHINQIWTTDMKRPFVQQVSLDPVNVSETLLVVAESDGDAS